MDRQTWIVRVTLNGNTYDMRTEVEGEAHKLLTTLGISPGTRMRKLPETEEV